MARKELDSVNSWTKADKELVKRIRARQAEYIQMSLAEALAKEFGIELAKLYNLFAHDRNDAELREARALIRDRTSKSKSATNEES